MEFNVDIRHPIAAGSAEPSHPWVLGLARDGASSPVEPTPQYSFQADCECPDDCSRDHENE